MRSPRRPAKTWPRLAGLFLATLALTCPALPGALEIDAPVVDEADVLSADEEQRLGDRLRAHHRDTGVQMAILLVDTTGDEPIDDFSLRVAEQWEGGSGERDDGVLLTLATDDRRSRLEVGYGLEARLTDSRSKRILDSMRPMLRGEDYAGALSHATEQVIDRTDDIEPGAAIGPPPWDERLGGPIGVGGALSLLGGILLTLGARLAWRRRKEEFPVGRDAVIGLTLGCAVLLAVGVSWLTWELAGPGLGVAIVYGCVAISPFTLSDRLPGTIAATLLFGGLFAALLIDGSDAVAAFGDTPGAGLANICLLHLIPSVFVWAFIERDTKVGGATSSSGATYSSSGYNSSGSSSSYSGGGGSFGGGGASSSW